MNSDDDDSDGDGGGGQPWVGVCALRDVVPGTGVCALIDGEQIAIFRPDAGGDLYALDNFDPFGKAFVLSRGILGDRGGAPKVASPLYKQSFDLGTGVCLDDPTVSVRTHAVRVRDGRVELLRRAAAC